MANIISFRDPKECDRSINLLVLLRANSEAIAVLKSKYGRPQNLLTYGCEGCHTIIDRLANRSASSSAFGRSSSRYGKPIILA